MMWKPGTAKPDTITPKSKQQNGTSPKSGGSSSKKLSSATMGMRFMKRKVDSSKKQQDDVGNRRLFAKKNNNTNNYNSSAAVESSLERKRDHDAISSSPVPSTAQHSSESNDNNRILELASVVDMYGVGSDIIGRRSFGGFHKSVRTTWNAALKQRTDSAARANNTRSQITDEELLERYEKYVKGGGGRDKRKQKRKR